MLKPMVLAFTTGLKKSLMAWLGAGSQGLGWLGQWRVIHADVKAGGSAELPLICA